MLMFTRPKEEYKDLYESRPSVSPAPPFVVSEAAGRLLADSLGGRHTILGRHSSYDKLCEEVVMNTGAKLVLGKTRRAANTEPVALVGSAPIRRWLLDTGASQHMVPRSAVRTEDLYPTGKPFSIRTANGTIVVKDNAQVYVPALDTRVEAIVLASTPPALSIGMLADMGFSFAWLAHEKDPVLSFNGEPVPLWTAHHNPYVDHDEVFRIAAPGGAGDETDEEPMGANVDSVDDDALAGGH